MKDEALQMCLEYIETDAHERKYVRHAIKQALAAQPAPVQEPVAMPENWSAGMLKEYRKKALGITTPPAAQRQWVGLTDEAIWSEYQTLWPFHPAEEPRLAKDIAKFARAIEAKLKEKNNG
jgi:hypothetical protein